MKQNYYATFGQGQYEGMLRNFFVQFSAEEQAVCAVIMSRAFGNKWLNVYDEKAWSESMHMADLTCIALVDVTTADQFKVTLTQLTSG